MTKGEEESTRSTTYPHDPVPPIMMKVMVSGEFKAEYDN